MTITAKFATVCPCCNNRINAGDKVEWTKGSKARHVACASKPATAPSAERRYYAPKLTGRASGAGSAAKVAGYSSYCTGRETCGCYDCAS